MDAIQRAVVAPQVEIVEQRAARRQVFRGWQQAREAASQLTGVLLGRLFAGPFTFRLRTNCIVRM
jgi:hypothetical protein